MNPGIYGLAGQAVGDPIVGEISTLAWTVSEIPGIAGVNGRLNVGDRENWTVHRFFALSAAPQGLPRVDPFSSTVFGTTGLLVEMPQVGSAFVVSPADRAVEKPFGNSRGQGAIDIQTYRESSGRVALGQDAIAIGQNCISSGFQSIAMGRTTTANAQAAIAIGDTTNASSIYAMGIGFQVSASGQYSVALGYVSSASQTQATAIGANSLASASRSSALGYSSTASGSDSIAIGDATASAGYAIAIGGSSLANSSQAVAVGRSSQATASDSVAVGYAANAYGTGSSAIGLATAGGNYAQAIGYNSNAANDRSIVLGYDAGSVWNGALAYTNGRWSSYGDTGAYWVTQRIETTNATTTALLQYAQANTRITLAANVVLTFRLQLAARQTAGTAGTVGDAAGWIIDGVIRRGNTGNVVLLGSTTATTYADAGAAAWTAAVVADTTNNALTVDVTGEANKTIRWTAVWSITRQA